MFKYFLSNSNNIVHNGKIIGFANRLGIYHCVLVRLRSYESLLPKSYVVSTHVTMDTVSIFRRETGKESK